MRKTINFRSLTFVQSIQHYANMNHDGNFTLAVIELCKKSLTTWENSNGSN